jgi:para-nitrobenzyl esterase
VLFTIATARGYWLDSVLQTERKAQQAGAPVYSFRLMWRTPVEDGRRVTPHSLDLPFVFDNVRYAPDMVGESTEETEALARAMSESWIAFARTGDPNNASVPRWAPYDQDARTVMHFDTDPVAIADPHRDERLAMARYPTQQARGRARHRT